MTLKEAATFETVRKAKVTCLGGSSTGEYKGINEVANVVLRLTGCESLGQKCTTPGLAEGEITTKKLEGEFGWEVTFQKVALALYPIGKTGAFAEYRCGAGGLKTITGSVLAPVIVNKMQTTSTMKYAQTAGKQKPDHLEGGPIAVLTTSLPGEPLEQTGLKLSATQVNEEAVEINAAV